MPTSETISSVAPAVPDYRERPVEEGFDWPAIITDLECTRGSLTAKALYLVAFSSERAPGADPAAIASLDHAAHEEAKQSPALLHYYADTPDAAGRALSWCLWLDDAAAHKTVGGPAHREAAGHAREFYGDNYAVDLYSVVPADHAVLFIPHPHPSREARHTSL